MFYTLLIVVALAVVVIVYWPTAAAVEDTPQENYSWNDHVAQNKELMEDFLNFALEHEARAVRGEGIAHVYEAITCLNTAIECETAANGTPW